MKPQRQFIAERALAQHCPELLRKGPGKDELLPLLARMGERLARRLSGALAPMLGGEAPVVQCTTPRESDIESITRSTAKLAANSLLAVGDPSTPMLVSIEAEPVLRIVDRAFGGKGEAPAPLPDTFPMAAELMIARLEMLLGDHLTTACAATSGRVANSDVPAIIAMRRDSSLPMLAPFPAEQVLAMLTMEVDDGGVLPWLMTFAMPMGTLARLFGHVDAEGVTLNNVRHTLANPLERPFGDVPLPVAAVLVDMTIPFSAIASLAPGQILPVAVARQVPLRVGDATIAHGAIGTMDDRMAIQITSAFANSRSQS
ncbi:flagellar motor switch protein FliM [Novosphingobium sp. FSY-8]|uniref:Flagellar motor switch protein FliM n=1 Tax=Novosphingobium ovatum TaxID=1908523 RepID=A0ABW9XG78_9SPHN|nr:flagellar motor switch protein FliM [Novosphingobium ovatum]NBC37516.1 flagellar motor switch protein FliM [Novosphingobium ovatum]